MLLRTFSKVDAEGKIALPKSIRRTLGLKEGQLVELKVVGTGKKPRVLISHKEKAR